MTGDGAVEVVDVPERNVYEIRVDGKVIGQEFYFDVGVQRAFYATEVDPAFGGRGLGGVLIHDALADAVAGNRRIVPICPFVVRWVGKHNEFATSIDELMPALLQRIPALPKSK
ncbi:GNAT family N-acetyltransferase [Nocardia nepalensis]|uniref:GNAT family N-acetyltransferase n=1 Tax=Nocardia nepalensis TaxID=3375448 RepID=UPI003B6778B1